MTETAINSTHYKSKPLVFFEYIALIVLLFVIALRATITEGLNAPSVNLPLDLSNTTYSLAISGLLLGLFLVWFVWSFCCKQFLYRFTALEFGIFLFGIAAAVASLNASDKRAAITDVACTLAPLLMAVLLVQILDSPAKIKTMLVVIAALGVVSAYQAADQLFAGNQIMVEQYEKEPQTMLEPLGIQPGSFQQFLFEHRLYSRGNHAYFTTRNSAGSFFLLSAFAALALTIEKFKNKKSPKILTFPLIASLALTAFVLFGLAITKSKGAIAAFVFSVAVFIALMYFGNWIKAHRRLIAVACLLMFAFAVSTLVFCGLTCDKLPGGSSMLVRWQYWTASVKMFAEHPLTGIGPANFANLYPRYKPPAALEAVANPHNFLLTILTQYGPLGLFAFLSILLVPLYKTLTPSEKNISTKLLLEPEKLTLTSTIIISAALLLIRPLFLPITRNQSLAVTLYVEFILYVIPVITFAFAVWLLTYNEKKSRTPLSDVTCYALFCAILSLLLHNLIDFAVFEPAVFTTFWALIACIIALYRLQNLKPAIAFEASAFQKILVLTAAALMSFAYFNYALVPVAKTTTKIALASRFAAKAEFENAHELLDEAAADDPISAAAHALNSKLCLQRFQHSENQPDLLIKAEKYSLAAISRNPAEFKNYENLTKIYVLRAQSVNSEKEKNMWLTKALDSATDAVSRYPGSGILRLELAQIAELLGKTDFALTQYRKTVQIEDAFRKQFKKLYPNRSLVSRLGQEKYQNAEQKIKTLTEKTPQ